MNKSFSLKTVNNKIDKYFIDDKSFEIHNMPITKTVVNQSNNNIRNEKFITDEEKQLQKKELTYIESEKNNLRLRQQQIDA